MSGFFRPSQRDEQRMRRFMSISGAGVLGLVPGTGTVALLHMDGSNGGTTFTDDTGKTCTSSGAVITSTTQKVFGTASLYNGASGGRVEIAHSTDFNFGTGPFTIEWREYRDSNAGYQNPWSRGYNLAGGMSMQSTASGNQIRNLYFINGAGVAKSVCSGIPAGTLNAWVPWAIVRDASGNIRVFNNGSQVAFTGTNADTQLSLGLTAPFVVGADSGSSFWFRGYIDEFRITNGFALYTAAGYTPAASPFTYP